METWGQSFFTNVHKFLRKSTEMYGIQISKKYGTRILGNAYFEAVIYLLNATIYSVTNVALLRGSWRLGTLNALNRSFGHFVSHGN